MMMRTMIALRSDDDVTQTNSLLLLALISLKLPPLLLEVLDMDIPAPPLKNVKTRYSTSLLKPIVKTKYRAIITMKVT